MNPSSELRPVQSADADAFQAFVMRPSAPSRRMRFHGAMNSCSPAMLQALTGPDSSSHRTWVAWQRDDGEAHFVTQANDGAAE